jgi:hypothetical protein
MSRTETSIAIASSIPTGAGSPAWPWPVTTTLSATGKVGTAATDTASVRPVRGI